jgi:hypothetical protein
MCCRRRRRRRGVVLVAAAAVVVVGPLLLERSFPAVHVGRPVIRSTLYKLHERRVYQCCFGLKTDVN